VGKVVEEDFETVEYDVVGGYAEFGEFGDVSDVEISRVSEVFLLLQSSEVFSKLRFSQRWDME